MPLWPKPRLRDGTGNTAEASPERTRYYDRQIYRLRHLVENAFLNFKQWRAVATRYAKRSASFLAICQIRALVLWTKLY